MGHGIQLAFNEISLVLFTTLAPSGVVALMLMGAPLLFGRVSGEKARRIDCFMGIPLAVSMVGLVMSATHLGNPDNVLYVFSRVGFSPLSNEVAGAVVFLALAGAYWLYSFARAPRTGVKRALTVALWCSGAAFLVLMAQAYSAETIISWNTAYVPLNMVLNGLVGGPLLALLGFRASSFSEAAAFAEISSFAKALPAASLCGVVANAVSMCLQNAGLHLVENELSTAACPRARVRRGHCGVCRLLHRRRVVVRRLAQGVGKAGRGALPRRVRVCLLRHISDTHGVLRDASYRRLGHVGVLTGFFLH